ncbi:MerR family transcriptional regulator [Candidatus Roizmanbacteria bacterium]|nr:MerR family transcriptional regulator [Candidatus Roizmanbacteria bacterium]
MKPVQSNLEKLITLKQASEILSVSIETLLSWNQHNILKPTITPEGEIGYTQNQIDQFLAIRQVVQKNEVVSLPTQLKMPLPETFSSTEKSPKTSSPKYRSSKMIITLAIFLAILSIAMLPQLTSPLSEQNQDEQKISDNKILGSQTSNFNLSRQSIAKLPIKLQNEKVAKKNLNNEGEDISQEKIIAPDLYEMIKPNSALAANNQQDTPIKPQPIDGNNKVINALIDNTNDLVSVGFFDTCAGCKTNKNSAIDESGNIQGEMGKSDTLAAIVGGIDEIVKSNSTKQTNTDTTNQLIFLSLGILTVAFVFQKQFAYPLRKLSTAPIDAYKNQNFAAQKTLEIGQKTDGTVVLYCQGKEYKISKPELHSESDQFIERLMTLTQTGIQEIEYEMSKSDQIVLTTPLSRLVTRLGFVGIKRDLFFPRTSKNSVLFRKYITEQDLKLMNLTTDQILGDFTKIS